MLLTSDWHLVDQPENEYRWQIFNALENAAVEHGEREIYMLGDVCDRKDRHSAVLVNRMIHEFTKLTNIGLRFTILMGNHDRPLNGPPFWQFLNEHPNILFIDKPTEDTRQMLLLPYSANPKQDWQDIDLGAYDAIFMHQTVTGVKENGRVLANDKMPELPNCRIYSGDIHTPQKVGPVTYVGAPHPVKYGDEYPCRMLILNKSFGMAGQIDLYPPRKCIAEVRSIDELNRLSLKSGDQVRVRWKLPVNSMDEWSINEEAVTAWQQQTGVQISSLEPTIVMDESQPFIEFDEAPESVMEAFGKAEGLAGPLLQYGLSLVAQNK